MTYFGRSLPGSRRRICASSPGATRSVVAWWRRLRHGVLRQVSQRCTGGCQDPAPHTGPPRWGAAIYYIKAPPPRHLFTSTSRTARLTASCSSMAAAVAWRARPVRYLHEEFQHWIMHYNIKLGKVLLTADVLRAQV